MDMEKFYVTTSIAYVNAPPHIGFALESLQADVLARYHRQRGADSFFLTGTDEHGAKIAKVAEASGKNPKQVVDENAVKFKELKSALNLSWDNFIRTSDQAMHWPIAQEI
jgi:methionyl-tRNA synthetase